MSSELSGDELAAVRALCDVAFAGDFDDDDFAHALGGVHALAYAGEVLVAHAAVVPRAFVLGTKDARCGYVEAVATLPSHQRCGLGGKVMSVVENVVSEDFKLGALAASEAGIGLYRARGWSPWHGLLYAFTPAGRVRTDEERGSVFVFGDDLDLDADLTCDYRDGGLW